MKEKIKRFLKQKDRRILVFLHKDHSNCLYDWHKIKNPARMILNSLVITIAKNMPLKMKVYFLRLCLRMKIGKNVGIAPDTEIDPYYPELISIEDNAIIGWKVNILCHEFTEHHVRLGRVRIGKNVIIGAFSSIRSGVTIGEHSIVAMDSFVNTDIPPFELWGGIPARKIKKLKQRGSHNAYK